MQQQKQKQKQMLMVNQHRGSLPSLHILPLIGRMYKPCVFDGRTVSLCGTIIIDVEENLRLMMPGGWLWVLGVDDILAKLSKGIGEWRSLI
jgi:hypothetical protein